jgi:hypothetical protein
LMLLLQMRHYYREGTHLLKGFDKYIMTKKKQTTKTKDKT